MAGPGRVRLRSRDVRSARRSRRSAANASDAWASATSSCRQSQNYKGRLHVSGRAGDQRIWPLAVETAADRGRRDLHERDDVRTIHLCPVRNGKAGNVVAATGRSRVVAPPGDIIEGILGVSLPPDRLLSVLTGCITRTFDVTVSRRNTIRFSPFRHADARVFLERDPAGWRARAGEVDGFIVELSRKACALPEKVWIRTAAGTQPGGAIGREGVGGRDQQHDTGLVVHAARGRCTRATDEARRAAPCRRKERGSAPR